MIPASAANAIGTTSGASASADQTRASSEAAEAIAISGSVAVWPWRSTRRPRRGDETPEAIAKDAVTAPADANEPVSSWIRRTIGSATPTLRPATMLEPTTTWTWRFLSSSP